MIHDPIEIILFVSLGYLSFVLLLHSRLNLLLLRLRESWKDHLVRNLSKRFKRKYDEEVCQTGPGWKILPLIYLIFLFSLVVSLVIEGNLRASASLLVLSVLFSLSLYHSYPGSLTWICRINFIHQFGMIWLFFDYFDELFIRRSVITSAVAAFSCVEGLDELFLQMFMYSSLLFIKYDVSTRSVCFMPLIIFVFCGMPFYFFEIREYISSNDFWKNTPVKLSRFGLVTIPILIISMSFSKFDEYAANEVFKLFGFLHLFIFFTAFISILIQEYKTKDYYCVEGKSIPLKMVNSGNKGQTLVNENDSSYFLITFILALNISILLREPVLFLLILMLVSYFPLTNWAFLAQLITLLYLILRKKIYFMDDDDITRNFGFLSLTTLRILSVFEERSSLVILKENSLFHSILILSITSKCLNAVVSCISFVSLILTYTISSLRLLKMETVQRETDAQSFILHALKQKFAVIGSFLEDFIESSQDSMNESSFYYHHPTEVHQFDTMDSCTSLLRNALKECRIGHDRCHTANVVKGLEEGRYENVFHQGYVFETLHLWNEKKELHLETIQFEPDGVDFEIRIGWEILKLILKEWTRNASCLKVTLETSDNHAKLNLTVNSSLNLNNFVNVQKLKDFVNATFVNDCKMQIEVELLGKVVLSQSIPFANLLTPKPIINEYFKTLAGLKFAVLDDNLMIRTVMARILTNYLVEPKKRSSPFFNDQDIGKVKENKAIFLKGANYFEGLSFPKFIIDNNVDIAIYDLHLEFMINNKNFHLSGIELAKRARDLGFKGCQILHSADFPKLNLQDNVFNGFVEKSSSRDSFIREIVRAWKSCSSANG